MCSKERIIKKNTFFMWRTHNEMLYKCLCGFGIFFFFSVQKKFQSLTFKGNFILQKISDKEIRLKNWIHYHHNKCLQSSSVGVWVHKCVLVLVCLWEAAWAFKHLVRGQFYEVRFFLFCFFTLMCHSYICLCGGIYRNTKLRNVDPSFFLGYTCPVYSSSAV